MKRPGGRAAGSRAPSPTHFYGWADIQVRARRKLPAELYRNVLAAGVGRGCTYRLNSEAYERITLQPRAALGYPERNLRTKVLGQDVSMPVLLAPVGGLRLVHPGGAVAASRAAARAGTVCVVSMAAGHSIREVTASSDGVSWQQLYLTRGRGPAEQCMADAADSGCSTLVVTVDCPVSPKDVIPSRVSAALALRLGPDLLLHPAWLSRFLADGIRLESARQALGPSVKQGLGWADIDWVRRHWRGHLVVKGILSQADARRAVDAGANAVVVSNHGGLSLDGVAPSVSALPGVVEAVGHQTEVLVDGGVRTGADVLKALALGARAVLIGRAYIAGLAVAGEAGVLGVLEMFRQEVDIALAMAGCSSVTHLDKSFVTPSHGDWNNCAH